MHEFQFDSAPTPTPEFGSSATENVAGRNRAGCSSHPRPQHREAGGDVRRGGFDALPAGFHEGVWSGIGGLAEQGEVTDRFAKAVEQLGSDKIDVPCNLGVL